MAGARESLSSLLKKTTHYDKDERYMATSDLCTVLQRHATPSPQLHTSPHTTQTMDPPMERKICTAILSLLDDESNDVQAVAVKTLGVLLVTVAEENVRNIAERLCGLVLESHVNRSELRDVYTIGLTTLIKSVPVSMGNGVSHTLLDPLVRVLSSKSNTNATDVPITLAALEVLGELITRFGSNAPPIWSKHETLLDVTLQQLSSKQQVVRKRAGSTIGCLAVVISDALLERLVNTLLNRLEDGLTSGGGTATAGECLDTRSVIRCMCTVSGTVGHRLGKQIHRIVPIFLGFCQPVVEDDSDDEDEEAAVLANELREACFTGFESFVRNCPVDVKPQLPAIIRSALAFMKYDPNYSYDSDDEDDDGDSTDSMEEEYEDDDEYEDEDDDDSWKVRRCAIRTICAVIESSDATTTAALWAEEGVAESLAARFKEREENCRVDVIDALTKLLRNTVRALHNGNSDNSTIATLMKETYIPKLVKKSTTVVKPSSSHTERTQTSILYLLTTICSTPQGLGSAPQITAVLTHVASLLDSNSSSSRSPTKKELKLEALGVFRTVLTGHHNPATLRECLSQTPLIELTCRHALQEDWYKLIAEALRCLAAIPALYTHTATPTPTPTPTTTPSSVVPIAQQLYAAIVPRLSAHDLDPEIKDVSLLATASLLSHWHVHLAPCDRDVLLQLVLDKIGNETTRAAALRALHTVVSTQNEQQHSPKISLDSILVEGCLQVSGLLKQQSRATRLGALELLGALVENHGTHLVDGRFWKECVKELALLVSDDLQISNLSLRVGVSILQKCPSTVETKQIFASYMLSPALSLSTSALLHDGLPAHASLLKLFEELVVSNTVSFTELWKAMEDRFNDTQSGFDANTSSSSLLTRQSSTTSTTTMMSRQSISNLSKCMAVVAVKAPSKDEMEGVITNLVNYLQSACEQESLQSEEEAKFQLYLLTTGEIGQLMNIVDTLTNGAKIAETLQRLYVTGFEYPHEEIRAASAYALGHFAVGSMEVFLPQILTRLQETATNEVASSKHIYLLLSSVKEVVRTHQLNGIDLAPSLPLMLPQLFLFLSSKEDGIRSMVAECLGSMICIQPLTVLPKLQELTQTHTTKEVGNNEEQPLQREEDARACWTIATAVKFAISKHSSVSELKGYMPSFLVLLRDGGNDLTTEKDIDLKEREVSVRNAALLMVYAAVHHQPLLLADLMTEHVLPFLYKLALLKLPRVVDLGPFKQRVDDALPLRKASLSIFAASLEKCPSSIDIPALMPILATSLSDKDEDVQLHAHRIVLFLCSKYPKCLVLPGVVESFCDPLEKRMTITSKEKNMTGTELERLNEWIKSALRVMISLNKVEGVRSCKRFAKFHDTIKSHTKFQSMLGALEEEH